MRKEFWRGKRVMITGHTGFKGSWLSLWLQSAGAELLGYALNPPTDPSLFEAAGVEKGMRSIIGDIRDLPKLTSAVRAFRPEILLHLAAQSVVRTSYKDPIETFESNVIGTVNVLESIRRSEGIRAAVIVTTDKCYENKEWLWPYRENEPLGGHDPYSASKACAEIATASYRRSFFAEKGAGAGVGIATARAGNVLGGGDWTADQLVPDLIRAFADGKPATIRNPLATRPWQFVLEPLNGYLLLAERLWEDPVRFGDAWNFGPSIEECKEVGWIADRLAGLWGDPAAWELDKGAHPHEAHLLSLDSSRAHSLLGWRPVLRIDQVLEWVTRWYREYLHGNGSIRELTLNQIRQFETAGLS